MLEFQTVFLTFSILCTSPLLGQESLNPVSIDAAAADAIKIAYAFDAEAVENAPAPFKAVVTGEAEKRKSPPKIADNKLYLLESWWQSTAAVAFPAPTDKPARVVEIAWKSIMNTGTEGAGFLWLNVNEFGADGDPPAVEQWEAPSLPASFGVGLDASNPPNRDPFRGSGNAYDRPQHEISLHWDGLEIVKRTTPVDFRDEEPHDLKVRIEFLPGGAEVTLWLDGEPLYDAYFIPSMTGYVGRPAFGARNSEIAGDVLIDDLSIELRDQIPAPEPPLTVVAIDHQLNDKDHPKNEATVAFPENTDRFARIICTLRLDKPETRFDPWDRLADVCVYDDAGERFEILRYITPYHRGHVWQIDVTDFRPLLRGVRQIEQNCSTQGEGWVVTVKFDFYAGPTDRLAYKVVNLWSGSPEIGNPDKPAEEFYTPKTVSLDEQTAFAKVRLVVTGHGMSPNTNNAAEFMPLGRTLTVNGESFTNVLWKADNYLNPCRPQGGTWKYDRAGWAPGDVVRPWVIDVSHLIADADAPSQTGAPNEDRAPGDDRVPNEDRAPGDDQASRNNRVLNIEYKLDPYVNEARGQTWAPFHKTESHLILYRKPWNRRLAAIVD